LVILESHEDGDPLESPADGTDIESRKAARFRKAMSSR
jgi:hypothetical protein